MQCCVQLATCVVVGSADTILVDCIERQTVEKLS